MDLGTLRNHHRSTQSSRRGCRYSKTPWQSTDCGCNEKLWCLEEANDHLGTIAKSGTEAFFKNLSGDQAKDSQLIGQFGVGFYSAFIVADRVTVISRSVNATEDEGVRWESEGQGTFTSENVKVPNRGTQIILHLKDTEKDFLET